jgi:hypothetical protein
MRMRMPFDLKVMSSYQDMHRRVSMIVMMRVKLVTILMTVMIAMAVMIVMAVI